MSDYSYPFFPSGVEGGESSNTPSQGSSQGQHHQPSSHIGPNAPQMPSPYPNIGYFPGFQEPITFQTSKSQSSRSRKKSTPGSDHVKHRRTRSGCYTCRSRRVKCDEARPTCERCRKGKRDCVYPEASGSKGASGSGSSKDVVETTQGISPPSSQDEADDEERRDSKLEPITDEEAPDHPLSQTQSTSPTARRSSAASALNLRKAMSRQDSDSPSVEGNKSSSPTVSSSTTTTFATPFPISDPPYQTAGFRPEWAHLSPDLQFYLEYFCETITHYNYCMVHDPDDFFRVILPGAAVTSGNEALLYALVGFSAYHHTVRDPSGRIPEFLQYYNKSVTMLLNSLKSGEKMSTATLMTILQLATIEEYLGDWVNLMGHQKAALEIIIELLTPQIAMQSPDTRMMITWYSRFDVFVGMLGGFETRIPREYFSIAVDYARGQLEQSGDEIAWKTERASAALRLISRDMSMLYARAGRGEIQGAAFAEQHGLLTAQLHDWRKTLDPMLTDANFLVTDFTHKRPLDDSDIVDPYAPGVLYNPPRLPTTLLIVEWHSIIVMHKSQEALALQQEPTPELRALSMTICQIFETMERWPLLPNGSLIAMHASLAIAALFVPRDAKHHMWIRKKYAMLEAAGYVFPLRMRARMAKIFRDPDCINWWLPNEEGLSPVVRSIRAFADERNANPVSDQTENLREMNAIFAKMHLDHTQS